MKGCERDKNSFLSKKDNNFVVDIKIILGTKKVKMTKTMIIRFDEKDEGFLLAFFNKMKVHAQLMPPNSQTDVEKQWIQRQLQEKYVQQDVWSSMSDDARQDAVLVEMMAYSRLTDDTYLNPDETKTFLEQLKNGTYAS